MQLVYRLAFTVCALLAFGAAVTACNSGSQSLTAPTSTYTPGSIVYSFSPAPTPSGYTVSVSQGNPVTLTLSQYPGNPANGIGTPNPLWPPQSDTCTNVYTVNGAVQIQSTALQFGATQSIAVVNNIKGIKVGTCQYVVTDQGSNTVTIPVNVGP